MALPEVFPAQQVQVLIQILRDNALETKRRTAFDCAWQIAGWVGGTFLQDKPIVTGSAVPVFVRRTFVISPEWKEDIAQQMSELVTVIRTTTGLAQSEPVLFDLAVTKEYLDWVSIARIIMEVIRLLMEVE